QAIDLFHFPIAAGQLRQLLASEIVEIEMTVAGAFAGPEEALSVSEEAEIVVHVDPKFIVFAEGGLCFACRAVSEEKIEVRLKTVETLDRDAAGILQPGDARQEDRVVGAGVHPADVAALRGDDANPGGGIGRSGDRVALLREGGLVREVVDKRILSDRGLVK